MNNTLGLDGNRDAYGKAWCSVMQVAVQVALPGYPLFAAWDLGDHGTQGLCDFS
jgi:hypothetical protein